MDSAAVSRAAAGVRLLGEIEEVSLEEVLNSLRVAFDITTTKTNFPKPLFISELDALVAHNRRATQSVTLTITGRYLPLVYLVVSTLAGRPHSKAVVIVDIEGRFDTTRLACGASDLTHIYVYRPIAGDPESLHAVIASAENWMLYGEHESMAREWWGTIVIGGAGGGDVNAGWKGWLRVDREEVTPFGTGTSAEEALSSRERRQELMDAAGWVATSQWGLFNFREEGPSSTTTQADVQPKVTEPDDRNQT